MNFLMQGFEAFKCQELGKERKTRADDNDDDKQPHTHFLAKMNSKVDTTSNKCTSDYNSNAYINKCNKNYVMIGTTTNQKSKKDHKNVKQTLTNDQNNQSKQCREETRCLHKEDTC